FGCEEGRSSDHWVDFDFFGHQLVCHAGDGAGVKLKNPVDGDQIPVPHFGVVLEWEAFHKLAKRLRQANVEFIIAPKTRFKGEVGEQATFFLYDPSGNALEFKAFKDPGQLFAK
ncbi:MAG: glyoxalase, partial [Sphingomonadales bacterium]